MFQQQIGEEKMPEMVRGECAFDTVNGRRVVVKTRSGIVDQHIHVVELSLNN